MRLKEVAKLQRWRREEVITAIEEGVELPGSSTFNRGRLKKTGTLAQSGYENNEPETHEPTGSMLPK
jgi:hypothetical protein